MFKGTLDARLQVSTDTLALMFGIRVTEDQDDLVEAAAAMARNRYDKTPWGEDRIGDAAEAAVVAEWTYNPTDGDDSLYYKANYVIGMASGMMRASAREDSAAQRFVQVFSDLIPGGIEDEEEYIEGLLGTGAVFSPVDTQAAAYDAEWEFNPDAAVFYTGDGVITLREVAKRIAHTGMGEMVIAEMFTSGDFSPVNDLSDDVYERLVSWVAGSDSVTEFVEEVEPETCPLDWVTITKDGVSRIELRRGMGCTTMTPNVDETYVAPYDYVTEEWTSVTLKDWTSWREALDRELAGIKTGVDGSAEGAAHLKTVVPPVRTNMLPESANGFSAEFADPEVVWNRAVGSRFVKTWWTKKGLRSEILVDVDLVGMVTGAIMNLKRALPKGQSRGITIEELMCDDELLRLVNPAMAYALRTAENYNQMMYRFAHLVSSEVFVKGTLAAIVRVAGVEYNGFEEVGDINFSMEKLRTEIVDGVTAGTTFASRAVVVLAKLDGLHRNEARAIGNEIYERSRELKSIFAQGRFSPMTEMLITERAYPSMGLNLPENVVGLVGKVSKDYVQGILAHIGEDTVIVGTTKHNRLLAAELGMRYIGIPRADRTWAGQRWAEGQVMASSTHVVAKIMGCNKQATAARLDTAGIQYRFE